MCTVTFIPVGSRVFITSNRDESRNRLPAEPPLVHNPSVSPMLYPKDRNKGGTWICANQKGDCGVLLNGSDTPHAPHPAYRHSRGLILPQLLAAKAPLDAFYQFDASDIEPFTLVLYVQKRLYECRWNGTLKSIDRLPVNRPHIWSSSTLYDAEMQQKRKTWFDEWIIRNPVPDENSIYHLHHFGGEGNSAVDFVMNRANEMLTVSITSVILEAEKTVMTYYSIPDQKRYRSNLSLKSSTTFPSKSCWRRFTIRLLHWEHWPFHLVYAPVYPYWLWLCLKARSLFFFTASNPTIRHGGFIMESKKEIYDLMPDGSYPKTTLVRIKETEVEAIEHLLGDLLSFPLIAKPDIGLRGIGVKLVKNLEELKAYHRCSRVNYLLQAYIPWQNEVGIFYCRMPESKAGRITGVVGKELLCVTGDGRQTIGELIKKEERSFLQIDALQRADPLMLTEILRDGENRLLVPYGNHSRGAKFVDFTYRVNEELLKNINTLCMQIPGFYFGRLDIRYNNWEELCAGKNFSVIELNGAGSEPAHIYDPKHSIFYGWKEIMRHMYLLYRISKTNKQLKNLTYLSFKEGVDLFKSNAAYMKKIS